MPFPGSNLSPNTGLSGSRLDVTLASFTTTPIYYRCALRFPQSGSIGEIEIPMTVTKLSTGSVNPKVTVVTYGAVIDPGSNYGSGGSALSYGNNELEKIQLEGFTDTPMVASNNPLSAIVVDGYHMTYGEIIAAYYEGRTAPLVTSNTAWQQVSPKWFRDPYGRVYSAVRIVDLTLQRVEGSPMRNTFTMLLQVA